MGEVSTLVCPYCGSDEVERDSAVRGEHKCRECDEFFEEDE